VRPSASSSVSSRRACSLALLLVLAACLSTAPPLPPVRWFDAMPPQPAEVQPRAGLSLRIDAAAHLGHYFTVRASGREVHFDGNHRWLEKPADVVATAIAHATGARTSGAGHQATVFVERFEIDLTAAPRAVVRLQLRDVTGAPLGAAIDAAVAAAGPAPEQLAAAMAQAVAAAVGEVARRL
jgi:ABC-type uncharacterized transport system auxiliary subunit